ncbi:MAG: PqqD family protein [Oscillospiraceae bacterium]|nr:PqqD family protein [Oscillospiraceae bacterium]MBR6610287.1 PqqD family protein [Oscillospiraceae bacterium]
MKIKKQLIKRDIAGDTILVPVGKTVYDSNGLFVLNEVATFIWDNLPELDTQEEIVAKILEEYEVSQEEAAKDTAEFLGKLREMQIID